MSKLLTGKDLTEDITSIEVLNGKVALFKKDGKVEYRNYERYLLHKTNPMVDGCGELDGNGTFKYFSKYKTPQEFFEAKKNYGYGKTYSFINDEAGYMCKDGVTYYKGMDINELRILSFDIETSGLVHNKTSMVYLISVTVQDKGELTRRLFSLDDYNNQVEMIEDFCAHVVDVDPHIVTGHNILGFDLPYLRYCAKTLKLGKGHRQADFSKKARNFRKDGSQSYEYFNCKVFGREVIDTFMLSIKYDIGRKYPSYSLKEIVKFEGLERKGRVTWDFSNMSAADAFLNPNKWKEFKEYCADDADDAIKLINIMLPSFFYYTQMVPLGMQEVILTASGSQLNLIMMRSYLQEGHSVPEKSEAVEYQGAISFGNPGLYKHVNKVDVASLYPSIIISDKVQDLSKDPNGNFLKIITLLTKERLENKRLANDTGERRYKDLEQAQKIIINSGYGFLGAPGLNFNYPKGAARITEVGRDILTKGIEWAKDHKIVNVDTDSFSYTTGKQLSKEEFDSHIADINSSMPDNIVWENDGQYKTVLVVKAKNYVLLSYKNDMTIKGSSLKATMKEPALKQFISELISTLLKGEKDSVFSLYNKYALEIYNLDDIARWSSKKTVTESILKPSRTNEQRILDAIGDKHVQEGDKIHVFFEESDKLCLAENFTGKFCRWTLLSKLYKTLEIFETVLDVSMIPNYKLKRNMHKLTTLGESDAIYSKHLISDKYSLFREPIKKVPSPYTKADEAIAKMCSISSKSNKAIVEGNTTTKK